ncbi:MAG: hypothetical protein ACE5JQ_17005 [Candidatus Methylomirabilales bacterium]
MTAIEILATIFAVAVLVKLAIVTVRPKLWMNITGPLLGHYVLTTIIYLILAVIVGYYVVTTVSIVEVAAIMLLTSLLIGIGVAPYSSTILKWREEILSIGVGRAWLAMVIWAVLAVWVLYAVFA